MFMNFRTFRKLEDTTEERLGLLEAELRSLPESYHGLGLIFLNTLRDRKDNVEITYIPSHEILVIRDLDGIQEDIFIQGHQVEPHVGRAEEIFKECPVLSPEEALYLATWLIVESLWN